MGFQSGEGFVDFTARDSKMNRVLGRMESRLRRTQAVMASVANVAKRLFLVGGAALGVAVKLAGDANEIMSKFRAVFKEQADAAEDSADRIADAVGRSRFEIIDFMATLQDTFVPLGFSRKKAAELSETLTRLTLDLASFNNKADPEVLRDLQSALVGNTETVRKYGIIITQASLGAELLRRGIANSVKDATEQEKVMGRLSLILSNTSDAQGDAIRTAAEFNNTIKRLLGTLKEATVELGTAFLPNIAKVASRITDIVNKIKPWIAANGELIIRIVAITAKILALLIVLPRLTGVFIALIKTVSFLVTNPLAALIIFLAAVAARFVIAAQEGDTFAAKLRTSFRRIGELITWLKSMWEVLWLSTKFVWKNILTLLDFAVTRIALFWLTVGEDIKHFVASALPRHMANLQQIIIAALADIVNIINIVSSNIGENIINLVAAIIHVIRTGQWEFAWTPMLEGFEKTVAKMFPILERDITKLEMRLAEKAFALGETIKKSFFEGVILPLAFPERVPVTAGGEPEVPGLPTAPEFKLPAFAGGGAGGGAAGAGAGGRGAGLRFVGLVEAFKQIATAGADPEKQQVDLQRQISNTLKEQTRLQRNQNESLEEIAVNTGEGVLR